MKTYKLYCKTGFAGATHEGTVDIDELGYSEEEWSKLNPKQIEEILDDYVQEWIANFIEPGWTEVE
jgi:hypothetical protein